jgi:hypothetical protein
MKDFRVLNFESGKVTRLKVKSWGEALDKLNKMKVHPKSRITWRN